MQIRKNYSRGQDSDRGALGRGVPKPEAWGFLSRLIASTDFPDIPPFRFRCCDHISIFSQQGQERLY